MSWFKLPAKRDADYRTCWGYTFQTTPYHLRAEEAHSLKFSWDVLADDALAKLNQLDLEAKNHNVEGAAEVKKPVSNQELGEGSVRKRKCDRYQLLRDNAKNDPVLSRLWDEIHVVPEFIDWAQIERGQDVFYRYGGPMLTGLAFQSLLGGLGAARIVETLARTGGFSTNVARHRLFETTQFLLQCTQSLPSIQPGGEGFAACVRVRLLHAAVRSRILELAGLRKGYYDVETLGIPINDLDCIATIGTFSTTLVWLALPRQGVFLKEREVSDFIALFRYIAFLMGTPTRYFETPAKARSTMESLLLTEINPTQTSRVLAQNVIKSLANQPPAYPSRAFLEATARWLNGNELCDALLGRRRPSLYHTALVAGQCIFFMTICYVYREFKVLDRRKITTLRKAFWKVIVDGKYGLGEETVFEFRYVPDFNKTTMPGKAHQVTSVENHVERRNFFMFLLTCILLIFGLLIGWKALSVCLAWTVEHIH